MKKIILFACFLFVLGFFSTSFADAADFGFTAVGEHPSAVNQPTALGKILRTAFLDGNKVYFGYGDYDTNTGPIDIVPFDADNLTFLAKEYTASTEAIYIFRKLSNGNLYALHTDPRCDRAIDPTCYFQPDFSVKDSSGWTQKMPVRFTHIYDLTELNGKIYIVGSGSVQATIYQSSDGGSTFSAALSLASADAQAYINSPTDFARFYFALPFNGKLYMQPFDYLKGPQAVSWIFDGQNWQNGSQIFPAGTYIPLGTYDRGNNVQSFAGRTVFEGTNRESSDGSLFSFDGTSAKEVLQHLRFYYLYENELYAIECPQGDTSCSLKKTSDLTNWELITSSVPSSATSFVIHNGNIFIGASDAKVYKSNFNLKNIKSFSLSLNPYFNTISLPFISNTTSIQSLLAPLLFSTDDQNPPSIRYQNGKWAMSKIIDPFVGVVIWLKKQVTVTLKGLVSQFDSTKWIDSLNLQQGWNQVGFPFEETVPIAQALAGIQYRYERVTTYNSLLGQWEYFHNPLSNVPEYLNQITQFEPGKSYFIYIK